jgi:ribosomal protein S27E
MAMYQVACPGCGAPAEFRSAASRMTVCAYCRSALLREADAVRDLGRMATLIEDHSPLQLMSTGQFGGQGFTVVGRVQLRYEHGVWNEWYLLFDDASEGWLGDFSGQFVITKPVGDAFTAPLFEKIEAGSRWSHGGRSWYAADIREAQCVAAEGELPFPVDAHWTARVVDYRSEDEFLTLDFSDVQPACYRGKATTLVQLRAQRLRDAGDVTLRASRLEGRVEALACPACGASIAVVPGVTQHLTCPSCASQVAASASQAEVLVRHEVEQREVGASIQPGEVMRIDDRVWHVMGWLRCGVPSDPSEPDWYEYLLFSPQAGFGWLVETTTGWQRVAVLDRWPATFSDTRAQLDGRTYVRRYLYQSQIRKVSGAFNWRAQAGDMVEVAEYVQGTAVLNAERSAHEMSWSLAEPVSQDDVATWLGRKLTSIVQEDAAAVAVTGLFSGVDVARLRPLAWVFTALIAVMNLRYMLPFDIDAMFMTGLAVFLLWLPVRRIEQSGD